MEVVHFEKSEYFRLKADELFNEQRRILQTKLPFADIQHVGGTVIPGLLTKGDLDINVRVQSEDFEGAVELLKELYEINQPENWSDVYASFKNDDSYILPLGIQVSVGTRTVFCRSWIDIRTKRNQNIF